jgi:hypothetical protein
MTPQIFSFGEVWPKTVGRTPLLVAAQRDDRGGDHRRNRDKRNRSLPLPTGRLVPASVITCVAGFKVVVVEGPCR